MPSPTDGLRSHLADAFSGTNLLYYAAAAPETLEVLPLAGAAGIMLCGRW